MVYVENNGLLLFEMAGVTLSLLLWIASLSKDIKKLTEEITKLSTGQNAQQAQIDSIVAQLQEAQANNNKLTTVVGNIKGDIDTLNAEIAKLQAQQQNGQPLDLTALVAVGASLQQTSASVLTAAEAVDAETPEVPPAA